MVDLEQQESGFADSETLDSGIRGTIIQSNVYISRYFSHYHIFTVKYNTSVS